VSEVRFCPSCGTEVAPGSRFCPSCGRPLAEEAAPRLGRVAPPLWVWLALGLAAVAVLGVVLVLLLSGDDGVTSDGGVFSTAAGSTVAVSTTSQEATSTSAAATTQATTTTHAAANPAEYCVVDTACADRLNVRTGPGGDYDQIGSLAPDATGVVGTGNTAVDAEGRTWVEVEYQGGVGWAAGWLLDPEPCEATECATLVLYPDGIGPWKFGDDTAQVRAGMAALLGPPASEGEASQLDESAPASFLYSQWEGLWLFFGTGLDERWPRGFAGYHYLSDATITAFTPEGIGLASGASDLFRAYPNGGEGVGCDWNMFVSNWSAWTSLEDTSDYYTFMISWSPGDDAGRGLTVAAGFFGWC
jgi:hypothetical protein